MRFHCSVVPPNDNRVKSIEVVPLALSSRSGDLTLSAYDDGRNNFLVDECEFSGPKRRVHALTLDDYCETHQTFPDALKIDVEGHEIEVIKGGSQDLTRLRPALVVECHCASWPSSEQATELINVLRDCGYSALWDSKLRPIRLAEFNQTVHLLAPGKNKISPELLRH